MRNRRCERADTCPAHESRRKAGLGLGFEDQEERKKRFLTFILNKFGVIRIWIVIIWAYWVSTSNLVLGDKLHNPFGFTYVQVL